GATLDPTRVDINGGHLKVGGSAPLALTALDLRGGAFDSSRPTTVSVFNAEAGRLEGGSSFTVPAGGSFAKTTAGSFQIDNESFKIGRASCRERGTICVSGGVLHLTHAFTVSETGVPFNCSGGHIQIDPGAGFIVDAGVNV